MQEAPKERTVTSVTASILKEEADFFKDDSVSNKGILFSLFSKITADVDFLKPNLVYRFLYSVAENDDILHHILYMEKLDGVARTKEHKELLCGSKYCSVELFIFATESGMEFCQEIEVINGEITIDREVPYSNFVWEAPDPRIGG